MEDASDENEDCELETPSLESLEEMISERAEMMEAVDKQVMRLVSNVLRQHENITIWHYNTVPLIN